MIISDDNKISIQDLHLKSKANKETPNIEAAKPESVATDPMDLVGQERNSIVQALEQTRWNKTAAAKLLGLSLRQLRYRLEKLNIE